MLRRIKTQFSLNQENNLTQMAFQNVIMPFSEYQNIIVSQGNMTHIMAYFEYQNVIVSQGYMTHIMAYSEYQNVIVVRSQKDPYHGLLRVSKRNRT